jgi:CrcB protein
MTGIRPLLAVALGGAAGSLIRWGLVAAGPDSWSTLIVFGVNAFGALLLGALIGRRERLDPDLFGALGTGLCGGLTTFSDYAVSVAGGLEDGRLLDALGNGLGTPTVALLAAGLGFRTSRLTAVRSGGRGRGPADGRGRTGRLVEER